MFNYKLVDVERHVDIVAENTSISTILTSIFDESDVDYFVLDRQIILSPKEFKIERINSKQGPTIQGRVVDENGEPLPGVAVMVQGTTRGILTDADGEYTIEVEDQTSVLVFSFVGYATQEVMVGEQTVINVSMEPEVIGLGDVVVIGYGTVKKSDLTGSVASVSMENIQKLPVIGIEQSLAGQASGVQVQQGTGIPGTSPIIRVRGTGSITAGNDPLYVIDGFPGVGDINHLNINDIESIEILKDASAAAIYGSRGSNGVVLITTKKGDYGKKLEIQSDIYFGYQEVTKKMDVMNAQEWVEFVAEAHDNMYIDEGGDINVPLESRPAKYQYPPEFSNPSSFGEGTDWQDEIFQLAPTQNYNLSLSGGTDRTQYFISGNYLNQDGIIKNSGFKKYSLRVNTDINISEKIKFGINLSPSYSITDHVNAEGHWGGNGAINSALMMPPIFPPYEADGSYGSMVGYGWNMPSIPSPLVPLYEMNDQRERLKMLGITYAELSIMKGLKFKSSFNFSISSYTKNTYNTSQRERDGRPAPQPPDASYSTSENLNLLNENTLTYSTIINGKHSINALVGFTAQKENFEDSYIFAINFPNDLVRTLNAGVVSDGNSSAYEWSLLSYLSRINYVLDNKYLITVSIRRDGSSRFGKQNKWGVFPSASLGWRVSEETFMQTIPFISNLKFRISYGFTGNNSIPNYGSIGLLNAENYVFGSGLGNLVNGIVPSSISNEKLGWEKTKQLDIGFELGLFQNRILFEMDNYYSKTTDLLLNVPVPSITGYTDALQNIGKIKNVGWEFDLTTRNFVNDFKWNTSLNISTNKNEVLALGPEGDPIYAGVNGIKSPNITQIGSPIGSYLGYIFEGIYNTQEEIDARPHLSSDAPGDPIIRDVNNDGIISPDDRTIIGDNLPDFIFGMTNSFSYKNFELSIIMQGTQGYKAFHRNYSWLYLTEGKMNVSADILDRWRSPENPGNGEIPRADRKTEGYRREASTLWVTDASYIRINNITLGYSLPENLFNQISLSHARIYFQVQNLATFTDYAGYNPEVSETSNPLEPGKDFGGYPVARTYTLGFNIQF